MRKSTTEIPFRRVTWKEEAKRYPSLLSFTLLWFFLSALRILIDIKLAKNTGHNNNNDRLHQYNTHRYTLDFTCKFEKCILGTEVHSTWDHCTKKHQQQQNKTKKRHHRTQQQQQK